VEKAATQFNGVNADHALPNVLIFVNHDDTATLSDLVEVLTGEFHASSGERFPTLVNAYRHMRGQAAAKIDLYVWIDSKTRAVRGYLFNELAPHHMQAVCDLLGLDRNEIGRL
jgi:hypothetical protein